MRKIKNQPNKNEKELWKLTLNEHMVLRGGNVTEKSDGQHDPDPD